MATNDPYIQLARLRAQLEELETPEYDAAASKLPAFLSVMHRHDIEVGIRMLEKKIADQKKD